MPKVRAQRKAFDPFRTINRSVGPFIGDLRLQIGVSPLADPNSSSVRSKRIAGCRVYLRIVKLVGDPEEVFEPCWRKIGECRSMKPFAVARTQGECANPLGSSGCQRTENFGLCASNWECCAFRTRLQTCSGCTIPRARQDRTPDCSAGEIPRWTGHRNTHFLVDSPNISVDS